MSPTNLSGEPKPSDMRSSSSGTGANQVGSDAEQVVVAVDQNAVGRKHQRLLGEGVGERVGHSLNGCVYTRS